LYGVCSRDKEVVENCAKQWECHAWTIQSLMLEDPNVDVIYISTPIGLHAEHIKLALNANKHVWCEKPFTSTIKDTKYLINLSRKKKLSICESYMFLYHPQFEQIYNILEQKQLGEIISVNCRFGIPNLAKPGFRNNPSLGGGAFLDVGCYPLIILVMLFPKVKFKVLISSIFQQDDEPVDSKGFAVISLSNGVTAYIEWGINIAYRNEINIWGTQKSIFSDRVFSKKDVDLLSIIIRDIQGVENSIPIISANHFQEMLKHFLEVTIDSKKSEAERIFIMRRAKLIEDVFSFSLKTNYL
jgi:hypothetical protein